MRMGDDIFLFECKIFLFPSPRPLSVVKGNRTSKGIDDFILVKVYFPHPRPLSMVWRGGNSVLARLL